MRTLIPHLIQAQDQEETYQGEFEALTMFLDVSGFTPMTQALMKHGYEGAEILATVMNDIFDALVDAVYQRGGFVSTFAGDAFSAIFPFNDNMIPADELLVHVLACVTTFQMLFQRHGIQTTPQGQFPLQFRVGLSAGTVDWGIVGSKDKAYFFRGEAIDGCVASEHQAEKGDVIFDSNVAQQLRKVPGASKSARYLRALQADRLAEGYYRIKKLPQQLLENFTPLDLPERPELTLKILAQFFPETLINFARIGEFRRVVSIFISFDGISTVNELNDWVSLLLRNINAFGGYFNRINFGDKGGFVLCGFGAPVTYENTMERALDFILSIKEDLTGIENLSGLMFRAGITYGTAYAGIAGGQKRCEYTYHGEVVNLAARFMMKAGWGEIFVSEVISKQATAYMYLYKGDFSYKGIAEPVPTYTLIGRKIGDSQQRFTEALIGRQEELLRLQQFAAPIFKQTFAGIFCIYGEAGIGKSRLAYALQEALTRDHDITWFLCPADQILQKPFNPFTTCFKRYFEQSSENMEAENKKRFGEKYQELIEALSPHPGPLSEEEGEAPLLAGEGLGVRSELLRTKSIIGAQLSLSWENSLWDQLDAKGKYENTMSAIKTFFLAQSLLHPTVIELEDGQWIDTDSLLIVESFTHNISPYPLFLLSTFRYSEYGSKPCLLNPQELLRRKIPYEEIELREFSETDLRHLAEAHLEGPIDEEFYAVLAEKTNGNPFFVEQLLHYFIENHLVESHDGLWQVNAADTDLPDTINAVLMARIDRLTDRVKEMVKAAAVIGREFDVQLLSEMLKTDVRSDVRLAEKSRIWQEVQELLYMFRHALLRDIAYDMQLKSRLRELHQLAAETIEKLYESRLATWYADLAFHYEQAENPDKAIEYLEKAGDEAKAQYHNQQALEFYDRLLAHLQNMFGFTELEIDTLLKKAEILELTGNWEECQHVSEEALELAEQIDDKDRMGQANLTLGIISRRTGQYDGAMTYYKQAQQLFEVGQNREGIGNVFRNMGLVYWQKNDSDAATACYEKALTICEGLGDMLGIARNAGNIGILYTELNVDYEAAMTWYTKSVEIFENLGEKLEISRVLNNIGECDRLQGHYERAMGNYEQTLQIAEELGDRLQMATTLGNIGLVYTAQERYDTAIESYNRAIAIGRELGNKYYLGCQLIDKAEAVFLLQHDEEALMLNAEGLQMMEDVGRKEYIFKGKVLSAKIAFAMGEKNAPHRLEETLQQTEDKTEIATLHYELWKTTREDEHRRTALDFYQTLYVSMPNIEYKERMEEMEEVIST